MRFLSDSAQTILGYSADDLIGNRVLSFADLIHPDDRLRICGSAEENLAERRPCEYEYRVRTAAGTQKWLWERSRGIYDANGKVAWIEGYVEDISARKQAEEQADLSEVRYKEAQRIARIGNWERDFVANQDWWSEELFSILGEDPRTFSPSLVAFLDKVHPDDRQRVIDATTRIRARCSTHETTDLRIVLHDGRRKTVHWQAVGRPAPKSQSIVVTGTVHDITERAKLEGDVVAVCERERVRIGHDLHDGLGQELTALSLRLQALTQQLADERSPHAQTARTLTAEGQRLIAETQRITRSLSPGIWAELGVRAALESLAAEVNEYSNVKCEFRCSPGNDLLDAAVARQLYRIAQEAINNALRHSNAQTIELRYGREAEAFCLHVLDDGIGIPDEHERTEGLGLRGMRYRARMINGVLDVARRAPRGTAVRCSFNYSPQPLTLGEEA
jgi:PAS domain S-box-containing protein